MNLLSVLALQTGLLLKLSTRELLLLLFVTNVYAENINLNEINIATSDFIERSVKCLLDEDYRKKLAIEAKNKINKYTWETAAKSFLKE